MADPLVNLSCRFSNQQVRINVPGEHYAVMLQDGCLSPCLTRAVAAAVFYTCVVGVSVSMCVCDLRSTCAEDTTTHSFIHPPPTLVKVPRSALLVSPPGHGALGSVHLQRGRGGTGSHEFPIHTELHHASKDNDTSSHETAVFLSIIITSWHDTVSDTPGVLLTNILTIQYIYKTH